jgi:hypothetical protein
MYAFSRRAEAPAVTVSVLITLWGADSHQLRRRGCYSGEEDYAGRFSGRINKTGDVADLQFLFIASTSTALHRFHQSAGTVVEPSNQPITPHSLQQS